MAPKVLGRLVWSPVGLRLAGRVFCCGCSRPPPRGGHSPRSRSVAGRRASVALSTGRCRRGRRPLRQFLVRRHLDQAVAELPCRQSRDQSAEGPGASSPPRPGPEFSRPSCRAARKSRSSMTIARQSFVSATWMSSEIARRRCPSRVGARSAAASATDTVRGGLSGFPGASITTPQDARCSDRQRAPGARAARRDSGGLGRC
jgi:hypothetical protein